VNQKKHEKNNNSGPGVFPDDMIKSLYTETYRVSSFDVGPDNRLSVAGLCRFLQETAWQAATDLGFGYASLESRNLVWILSRFAVQVHRYPDWEDEIIVQTWPAGIEKLFAFREFRVLHRGEECARGSSAWLTVDQQKRRPRPMKDLLDGSLFQDQPRMMPEHLGRLPVPDSHSTAFTPYTRQVVFSDLDRHAHVNNVKYIEWILDAFPCDWFSRNELAEFQINFLSETRCSEGVQVELSWDHEADNAGTLISAVRRLETNTVSASARVVMRPVSG
jgi:medium-chain acyl-[acyl-carrier-protein] hydrolase